jgi:hypothetical protein
MTAMVEAIERYRAEAERIRKAALLAAERHFAAETPWYHWTYWLGLPSTILSAIASAAAFSEIKDYSKWIAGTLALAAAIFSGVLTYLNPDKKGRDHHRAAKEYEALYNRSSYFYEVELDERGADLTKLAKDLKELSEMLDKITHDSPAIPKKAYQAAEDVLADKRRGEVLRYAVLSRPVQKS